MATAEPPAPRTTPTTSPESPTWLRLPDGWVGSPGRGGVVRASASGNGDALPALVTWCEEAAAPRNPLARRRPSWKPVNTAAPLADLLPRGARVEAPSPPTSDARTRDEARWDSPTGSGSALVATITSGRRRCVVVGAAADGDGAGWSALAGAAESLAVR